MGQQGATAAAEAASDASTWMSLAYLIVTPSSTIDETRRVRNTNLRNTEGNYDVLFAITFTGMPTYANAYVHLATVKSCRTHPCDAG